MDLLKINEADSTSPSKENEEGEAGGVEQENKENKSPLCNLQQPSNKRCSFFKLFDPLYDSPIREPIMPLEEATEAVETPTPPQSSVGDIVDDGQLVQIENGIKVDDNHDQIDMDLEEAPVGATGDDGNPESDLKDEACGGDLVDVTEAQAPKDEVAKFQELAEQLRNYENIFQSYNTRIEEWSTKYDLLEQKYKVQTKSFDTFETAFQDLLKKYQESKGNVQHMMKREKTLVDHNAKLRKLIEDQELRFKTLKDKVTEKLECANEVNGELKMRNASEQNKLNFRINELNIALSNNICMKCRKHKQVSP